MLIIHVYFRLKIERWLITFSHPFNPHIKVLMGDIPSGIGVTWLFRG